MDDISFEDKLKQFMKQFQSFAIDVCKYKLFQTYQYVSIPELPEYTQKMLDEPYDDCIDVVEWARKINSDIKWESAPKPIIEAEIVLFCRR
jgi:hypothetical protein